MFNVKFITVCFGLVNDLAIIGPIVAFDRKRMVGKVAAERGRGLVLAVHLWTGRDGCICQSIKVAKVTQTSAFITL